MDPAFHFRPVDQSTPPLVNWDKKDDERENSAAAAPQPPSSYLPNSPQGTATDSRWIPASAWPTTADGSSYATTAYATDSNLFHALDYPMPASSAAPLYPTLMNALGPGSEQEYGSPVGGGDLEWKPAVSPLFVPDSSPAPSSLGSAPGLSPMFVSAPSSWLGRSPSPALSQGMFDAAGSYPGLFDAAASSPLHFDGLFDAASTPPSQPLETFAAANPPSQPNEIFAAASAPLSQPQQNFASTSAPPSQPQENSTVPASSSPAAGARTKTSTAPRAPRKTKGIITLDEPITCIACRGPIGTALLHGFESVLSSPHKMTLTCLMCNTSAHLASTSIAAPPDSGSAGAASAAVHSKRKRRRKVRGILIDTPMDCIVCLKGVGVGRMRAFEKDASVRRGEAEVQFDYEVVCQNCWIKYKHCSACGGGGSFRTGKWRPREVFEDSRLTCTLSHERLGAVNYTYEPLMSPQEISPSFLESVSTMWTQNVLKYYASPARMEALAGYETYEK
ncbi:hypothetical protein BDK51DRAFT_32354, partial [Blyttiomyces helicus]